MATSRRSDRRETTTRKMRIQFSATGDKRVVAAFERVDQGAKNSTEGLEGFRGSLLSIDAAMGIAAASMGAMQQAFDALKAPVGLAVDWEKQFAQIRTLNSAIGNDLEKQLLDLAGRVPQTAGDIAQSAYSAISAGIDPTEVVGFLEAASKAATAGSSTMAEATTALTKTLAGFKTQGLEAERAMDILFATVKRGDTNFTDLSSSVGMVAGAMGSAGGSAEEMGAAVATLSKSAPNTAIAVTQLNAVLKALQSETGKGADNIRKYAGATGAANLKSKGLIQVLKEIKAGVGDDVTALNSLTNSMEAQAGFNTLLSGSMEELLADYEAIQDSTGALNEANALLADTTQTAVDGFNAMKESALREIGQVLLPDINKALKEFGGWWEENGAATLAQVTRLYKGIRELWDVVMGLNDYVMTMSGLKFLGQGLAWVSESIGLTTFQMEKLKNATVDYEAEAKKLAKTQRKATDAFIENSEDAIAAIIKRGDAVEALAERERQVEALRVQHMAQETATLQTFYQIQALERMKAQAQGSFFSEERVKAISEEIRLLKIKQNEALKGNDALLASMRKVQDMDVKAAIAEEKRRKKGAGGKKPKGAKGAADEAARVSSLLRQVQTQAEALSSSAALAFNDALRFSVDADEQRLAFGADLLDRQIDLIKDASTRRIAALQIAQEREMEQARVNGQDVAALRVVQNKELNKALEEENKAQRKREEERLEKWGNDFRQGTSETLTAMSQIAEGAKAIGVNGDLAAKALSYTQGLVSAADAISYGAQSLAAFGSFNYFSAFKYAAAAVGAGAASAAYFKAAGKSSGGASSIGTGAGGSQGATVAQSARASESDLGRSRSGSSGPTTLTYQLNFNAPVFDTPTAVDRAMAQAVRRQQRAPGGVSIVTDQEIKRAARV